MTGAVGLLKLLASGAAALTRSAGRPAPKAEGGFASLLDRARSGSLSSGLGVTVDELAGVELTPEQLARLADAADRAQAQGAQRALVLIDGQALTLDVAVREITGKADFSPGKVLTGIDAVVHVPPAGATVDSTGVSVTGPPAVLPLPGADAGLNPSLMKLLRREPSGPARVH